jgi:Na+/H+ antiporter NhaA
MVDIRIKIEKSQSFREDLFDGIQKVFKIIEGLKKAEEAKKKKEIDKYEILEKENPSAYNKLYNLSVTFHWISVVLIALFFILVLVEIKDLLPFHSEQIYEVAITLFSVGAVSYLMVVALSFGLSKMADNELEKYKNRKKK